MKLKRDNIQLTKKPTQACDVLRTLKCMCGYKDVVCLQNMGCFMLNDKWHKNKQHHYTSEVYPSRTNLKLHTGRSRRVSSG